MASPGSYGSGFCDDPLWDTNRTWYTDNPDFTTCFHQTVLVYTPSALLVLLTPFELYFAKKSRSKNVPWSFLNVARTLLTIGLTILPILDLSYIIRQNTGGDGASPVHLTAAIVKILSFIWALGLHLFCMKNGMVTSGVLTCFWGFSTICGIFSFRSVLMTPYVVGAEAELPFTSYVIQFPLVTAIFFLSCWADPKPRYSQLNDDSTKLTPEKYASFVSKSIFSWFTSLAVKGWKKNLKEEDLWDLDYSNTSEGIVPLWEAYWNKALAEAKAKKKKISIVRSLWDVFGPQYSIAALLQLLYSVLQFASPQIVNLLIDFVQSDDPVWKGYFYTVLICIVSFFTTILNSQTFYIEYIVGMKVKTALISSIYKKSTRLSNNGRKEMTVGETTNLMSIDTQKFQDLMLYLNMAWSSPLQIALAMFFLWQVLGPSSMAGLAIMVLMIPLNGFVAQKMKKYQVSQMKDKDRRSKLMDEILNGIKVLKLYAWEPSFQKKVLDVRMSEVSALIKSAYLNSVTTFLWTSAPFLVALASFTTFVLSSPDNILDANTAFVSLTLFNLLRLPLNMLPMLLVFIVQCQVSVQRVNKFMNAGELDGESVSHDVNYKDPITVESASFSWDDDKNSTPVLRNINMKIPTGALVAVVGNVGSGKSSLISSLLGELTIVSGKVNTLGKVAFVPQQAWMQNASLRDNITFGKKYNDSLYKRVLEACALTPDLKMLPAGDKTEIGEKGINLSGGQKQRVSMARSVYSNGSLYLLDDPLSAVDSHVGKHIFEQVIGPTGLLKNKTRVLVTNAISYLPQTDHIYVMKDGRISEQGTYHELLAEGGEFADFLVQYISEKSDKDLDPQTESELEELKLELENVLGKETVQRRISSTRSVRSTLSDFSASEIDSQPGEGLRRRKGGRVGHSTPSTSRSAIQSPVEPPEVASGQVLIEDEKMEIGGVKWSVYRYYGKSIGFAWAIACLLFFLFFQAFQLGGNIWLSAWSTDPEASTDIKVRNKYLIVYGVLGLCQSSSVMVATAIAMVATLKAATKLHGKMLSNILRSPMAFFDTTPLGRVLNRFSKDMDIIDVTMPMNFRLLLVQLYNVVGTMFVICYSNPLFISVVIPIGIMYYLLQKFYVTTARQVKRLESVTRSPIYSHFGETISGSPTIRAYGAVPRFIEENEKKIDRNQICYYPTFASSRWLSVRLETTGNLVILFASLFAVIARDRMDPGKVGLSLSYALNVTGAMNLLVRMTSEVETNMVSVERIMEYQEVVQEAPYEIPENDLPPSWPEYGVVKFDDYRTRYREGLDLVLRGLSFETLSGEKVGIVGRTGAGKSSLTLALFRIVEAAQGSILIDGENIGHMGLGKLRSRLTIIPQDPVLFSGSMRTNLDPFNYYSDRDVWKALELAHLRSFVSNLPGGLNFEVNEGGENLSVGQRQLVCLARALLRKTKVLILDEATAAVDMETDDLIQQTIRAEFGDCTVLTIAHRLNTIMDSSRVMVLDAGLIREFDTPEALLRNKKSIFYGMARDAGLTNEFD